MSDNHSKPPMTDIVSAAQKSIKSNSSLQSKSTSKPTNLESKSPWKAANKTSSPATKAQATITKAPIAATKAKTIANKTSSPATKPKATITKAPIAATKAKTTANKTSSPATKAQATITKAPTAVTKVTPKTSKTGISKVTHETKKNNYGLLYKTNDIVQILCNSISNAQEQALEFSNNKRLEKEKLFSRMQLQTCDKLNEFSTTCIEATKTAIQSKNPFDIISNQTKTVSKMQQICSNILNNITDLSWEYMNQNIASYQKKQAKK